ncbi:MAG TPA: C45 family peptidase [Ktedonobacterales bacterium]|jgi:isopenicillin-N N-acyltransferase-like protein
MPDRQIPLVVSEGVPYARGLHLGRAQAQRVNQTVSAYRELFKARAGLDHAGVLNTAERFIPLIRAYAPHLLEEMRGIAEGAGHDLREIVAINSRTELMYGVPFGECTSLGVTPEASSDGHMRLAQNWDWKPPLAGALVLWAIRRDDGPDVLTLTEAGMVGKIGVNASGFAMCVNLLTSDLDTGQAAVPMHIILRRVLEEAHGVDEAIALIGAAKRQTSCNHLIADRGGHLADVEATPFGRQVLSPTRGVLAHANHCLDGELALHDRYVRDQPETLARSQRATLLAEEPPIDEARLRSILSDHATAPNSICLHVQTDLPPDQQDESIASLIFDLTAGTLDIADGPPCQYPYRRLMLGDHIRIVD